MLCDPTHDNISSLGLIDKKTCIIYRNKDEIKEKIEWILDVKNREEVDKIRREGMNLVKNRHMVSIRCNEIDEIVSLDS